jgi:hypothetical protein
MRTLAFAGLLLVFAGSLFAQQPSEAPLTNADVIKLVGLHLGDDVVIAKVNEAPAVNFDLSPEGLSKLQSSGASSGVITVMLKRSTPASQRPIVPEAPAAAAAAPETMRGKAAVGNEAADSRPCVANFSVTGNLMSARTANSFQEYPKGTKSTAFPYLIQRIGSLGSKVTASDKDSGLISAGNDVRFSNGSQSTTTNVVVTEQSSGGIRIEITYRAPFGVTFNRPKLQDAMCSVLEGVPN